MDAKRLKQIEEIYHAALEIQDGNRESFFKEFCGGDETLRREVESLLAFEKTSDNFIDTPPESLAAEMFTEGEDETTLINKEIKHYNIKKLLGKGGMGEVYLALDTKLKRQVALKILSGQLVVNSDRLSRFVQEARAASALNHPNIITIYEIGEFAAINFIATEFIDGETLRDHLTNGKTTLNELLSIAVQTAEALSAAHAAGIIHRDIKPENIMIRRDGYIKILDFGLAKLTENRRSENNLETETRKLALTMPGAVMGTVSYMSPEQTRGLANIDARSDIWSLGVVIFEMLTGRTPFSGETVSDVIASILKTEAPQLSKSVADCPPELERIVAKTLQKDREERYQVIKDLALDLKSLRKELEFSAEFDRVSYGGEKNLTAEIPKTTSVGESARRFSLSYAFSILLLAGVLLTGVWWFFLKDKKLSETTEAAMLKTAEIFNWSSSPGEFYSVGSFSPDGKMVAFTSTKVGKKNLWIKQTASGEAIQITKDEFKNDQPIWSPNGEELAFYSTRGDESGFWRIPILGGSPKLISRIDDGSSRLRFWSKNNLIYYESKNDIFAIDINSGQTKQITDLASKGINGTALSLSPDEKNIGYASVEGDVWNIWTTRLTGETPKKLFSSAAEIKNMAWHPDNQRLFYSALTNGTFQIYVTDIYATASRQLTFSEQDCFVLDVSSDGTKILYGSAKEESDVWGVNLADSKEFIAASDIDSELWADVSPDGKTIAYQSIKNLSQGNKLFNGNILTKTLSTDEQPVEIVKNASLPKWAPDGKSLSFVRVVGDKYQIETIKAPGGDIKRLTTGGISSINFTVLPYNLIQTGDLSWSADSNKIAYISEKGGQRNIWLVNADGSNDVQLTENNDSNLILSCPLWSPDGKRIAFSTKTNNASGIPLYSVQVIDTETKKTDPLLNNNSFIRLIGWSQSGNELILVSAKDSTIGLPPEVSMLNLKIVTREMRQITMLKDTYLYNIHLSPDKKTLAFVSRRETKDNVWMMSAMGGEARKITNNNDSRLYFSSLAWSPDNRSIFFGKQLRFSLLSMLTNFQ